MTDRQMYCYADPAFYESPERWDSHAPGFGVAGRQVPAEWCRTRRGFWITMAPVLGMLPDQGWKIHLSSSPERADDMITKTWDYCVENGLGFKFLASRRLHFATNSKYAPRASSGKLVTVYPPDARSLRKAVQELVELFEGWVGPTILGDLRVDPGAPVHVRYGAFSELYCTDPSGREVLALRDADGKLVPDVRKPFLRIPEWVDVPEFLRPALASRTAAVSFGYQVREALHFSNAGGVYRAVRDADDRDVVLKEARPHAGLDRHGHEAVHRLRVEGDALDALAGLPCVPEVVDRFEAGGHHYLVTEHIEGSHLWIWMARHHPMIVLDDPGPEDYADYARRALGLLDQVELAVRAVHARGLLFGDLHFGNVIVRPDERICLVDFELAYGLDDTERAPAMQTMGFAAAAHVRGADIDLHSLASLKAALLLPLEKVRVLDPGQLDRQVALIARRFPLPDGFLDGVVADLRRLSAPSTPSGGPSGGAVEWPGSSWSAARDAAVTAIRRSAETDRDDRLFPGDAEQFSLGGGLSMAHGAAGVLWALHTSGAEVLDGDRQWLLDAVGRAAHLPTGFYDGAAGIAYALERLGHEVEAEKLLVMTDTAAPPSRDIGLASGLAGLGLCRLHFARSTGESARADSAVAIADRLAARLDTDREHPRAGLMHGWSGPALLFCHLYDHTADPGYLDLAVRAVSRDLSRCVRTRSGSLQVAEAGTRTLAYLDVGSAGIALVVDELLGRRPDDALSEALVPLLRACSSEFVLQPQLWAGRAGLLSAVERNRRRDPELGLDHVVRRHLDALGWHAVPFRGGVAFPGEFGLRLSMDLATGTAGVLLGVTAVTGERGAFLPFFTDRPAVACGERPADVRQPISPGGG